MLAARPVRALIRARWAVLLLLAGASVASDRNQPPLDVGLFLQAGNQLLSRDWANVFSDKTIQIGPLMLAFFSVIDKLAALPWVTALGVLSITVHLGGVVLVVRLVRRASAHLGLTNSSARELAAGVLLLALDAVGLSYESGHPSELLVAVLWFHALLDVREGRPGKTVWRVVLAAGLVTQGALGLVVLLAVPAELRRAARWLAAGAAGSAAWFLPFALFGTVRTSEYTWSVMPRTLPAYLLGVDAPFSWHDRLVQGAVVAAAGLACALLLRGHRLILWLLPLAIVSLRAGSDPRQSGYYWIGSEVLFVVALCLAGSWGRSAWPALACGYAAVLNGKGPPWLTGLVILAGAASSIVLVRRDATKEPSAGHLAPLAKEV